MIYVADTYREAVEIARRRQPNLILIEIDQSDRLSWILSRNEDRTYALDVRVRHVF